MYEARAQQLAKEYAPRFIRSNDKGELFTFFKCTAFWQAKEADKQYRRALLDLGAIHARTAVELGWHFERLLRREARALVIERFREQTQALSDAIARALQNA